MTARDYWRGIVLYGDNSATYKLALAAVLMEFAQEGRTEATRGDLAAAFFRLYRERLRNEMPQQANPTRKTVL